MVIIGDIVHFEAGFKNLFHEACMSYTCPSARSNAKTRTLGVCAKLIRIDVPTLKLIEASHLLCLCSI